MNGARSTRGSGQSKAFQFDSLLLQVAQAMKGTSKTKEKVEDIQRAEDAAFCCSVGASHPLTGQR